MKLQTALKTFAMSHSKMDGFLLLLGMFGMGKTQVAIKLLPSLIARHHGIDVSEVAVLVFHLASAAPDEVQGFCMPKTIDVTRADGKVVKRPVTIRTMPELITAIDKAERDGAKHVVVILDEWLQCEESMHIATTQFARERRIGQYGRDVARVSCLALSNREGDGCATNTLPEHTKNGGCIIEVEPCVDSWADHMLATEGCHDLIVNYVLDNEANHGTFIAKEPDANGAQVATYRSVTRLSKALQLMAGGMEHIVPKLVSDSDYADIAQETAAGMIGEENARALLGHMRRSDLCKSWEQLQRDPSCPGSLTVSQSLAYKALFQAKARQCEGLAPDEVREVARVIVTCIEHCFQPAVQVPFARAIQSLYPALRNSEEWIAFATNPDHREELREVLQIAA